ncbi:MAG: restriction endonuclease subunit R [Proteobacteria bacterium]|nr:MAG: restriction endonuclease subunit R [Pseudomonadota bacterium]
MAKIPIMVERRLKSEVPRFQKILAQAQLKDINEADTVAIVADMLEGVFGYDKYEDITREFAIKNTYVDLAVKTEKEIDFLIEVKSIGTNLKNLHLKQAVDYAANRGVQWAILTNGVIWQAHRVTVDGRVSSEEVFCIDFLSLSIRNTSDLESVFLLCKKGLGKGAIDDYYQQSQAFNKYVVGTILQSENIAKPVRTLLRKISPGLKVDLSDICEMISKEVIKREITDSQTEECQALIKKTNNQIKKINKK